MPLEEHSLDVGVFSLSLMGTNYVQFLTEANRVLKPGGKLFIAEVTSRFKDVKEFVKLMKNQVGFEDLKVGNVKDFFYMMVFIKVKEAHVLT